MAVDEPQREQPVNYLVIRCLVAEALAMLGEDSADKQNALWRLVDAVCLLRNRGVELPVSKTWARCTVVDAVRGSREVTS